jgi:hypothetical protein
MRWQTFWDQVRRGYRSVNAFLEALYYLGPAAHGVQGVLREFLDGPPDGVRLTWTQTPHGPLGHARDHRGSYRIELVRQDGRWSPRACSCLGFLEFRRDCRHLRAARAALASSDPGFFSCRGTNGQV